MLIYFRLYPTQAVQGFLFGIGQAQANQWVHRLTRVRVASFGHLSYSCQSVRSAKLEAVLNACPSLEFMIDGTERLINRPKDFEDRKTYYSGKKKAHTVKNNLISERGGKVLFLSDTYYGLKHDNLIADEEGYRFPKGSTQWPRYWVPRICPKGGQHQATEEEATVSRTER
ncbi:transposase family protein [Moorena sp. SIO4G3]|uniref:transposase family protein n=1 Tax=Moorena sp. SIO4G3 TaxID=2607821 RepID=UPI0025E01C08|nr:transposase family protein [Moorena sp. SIO4G3]